MTIDQNNTYYVRPVRNSIDLEAAFNVRRRIFIGEQNCPLDEEFDGNDYVASHFILLNRDDVIGTIRVRYFNDFAKLERVSVLDTYRSKRLGEKLVREVIQIVSRKGFSCFHIHAQTRYLKFWNRIGFSVTGNLFYFSDFSYYPMTMHTSPHDDKLNLITEPIILIRPEGSWDQEGILDISSKRQFITRQQ